MTWGQLAADIDRLAGPGALDARRLERRIDARPEQAARLLAGAILARPEVAAAVPPALYRYWLQDHAALCARNRRPGTGPVRDEVDADAP